MTEEEAKKKWCPFVNAHGDSFMRAVNPDSNELGAFQHTCCIASACMAWRQDRSVPDTATLFASAPAPGPNWVMDGEPWDADPNKHLPGTALLRRWKRVGAPEGFCGLAGEPR